MTAALQNLPSPFENVPSARALARSNASLMGSLILLKVERTFSTVAMCSLITFPTDLSPYFSVVALRKTMNSGRTVMIPGGRTSTARLGASWGTADPENSLLPRHRAWFPGTPPVPPSAAGSGARAWQLLPMTAPSACRTCDKTLPRQAIPCRKRRNTWSPFPFGEARQTESLYESRPLHFSRRTSLRNGFQTQGLRAIQPWSFVPKTTATTAVSNSNGCRQCGSTPLTSSCRRRSRPRHSCSLSSPRPRRRAGGGVRPGFGRVRRNRHRFRRGRWAATAGAERPHVRVDRGRDLARLCARCCRPPRPHHDDLEQSRGSIVRWPIR